MALTVPVTWRNVGDHLRRVANAINQILDGHTNNAGSVTLTASATSTVVTDARAGTDSVIVFMPTTANAATAAASLYVSARTSGQFTLTHASNAAVDQDFEYALLATGRDG